ncbi:UDP-N-acetylmuramoyl-tripeptide--D-alanyl-D-alanine ligase [Gaoshiqia sediminis]|uniref:UDP-N-acetylmuramoyl-tripeptide--D-alanyl-D-alanine ligase n=1 Tax=Gaoshiqia sediminis TaxID=2986998 RepID=A0AA41Y8E7_9BACT|nr:UDP-N-acetylmuramoyl-tripeptide--D-alanyl-D-alanine ligase [Gaoshiqia sediminis]MCW0481178.1 UDP-N-acetylmuramoyl-tripeptide--D-alanyl-D-alanine ligase [Gaoshiqia sediminis]
MNTEQLYQLFLQHPTVSTDTRNIPEGGIFFALKGQHFDGNTFAAEALTKGAAYAVIDNADFAKNDRIILVNDVLTSLQQLANHHRKQLQIPILAITGSNGKTTTKELIGTVLQKKYQVTFTQGNLNNHIGVPLTLLSLSGDTEIAVIEMGANHPGEIAKLCQIAEPNFGLITNIGKAHLEGFGSFEGVVKTKSELYDFLRNHSGKCFINSDNELLVKQAAGLEHLSYGTSDEAQLQGQPEETSYYLTVKVLFPKGWLYLKSKLIGSYNFENILAAARIGLHFGVDPLEIQQAIESYQPSNNRSQLIQKGSNRIIMDAYNANPTSMMAALTNFASISHSAKTIILGDMLELGEYAANEHQKIADFIDGHNFDNVFLVGKCFLSVTTGPKIKKFDNAELLSDYLYQQKPIEDNLILIKGSRGIQLEKILEKL